MAEPVEPQQNGTKDDTHNDGQHMEIEASNLHNFAVVCRLLCEGAPKAMRDIFNRIHPPINLPESLSIPATSRTLRRLKTHSILSEDNWTLLFPGDKQTPKSRNFSATLLGILLRHICHLTPPYPNGWDNWPVLDDTSLSADLARLSCYRQQLAAACGSGNTELSANSFTVQFEAIAGVMRRLHPQAKTEIQNIQEEMLDAKAQQRYLQAVVAWQREAYGVGACEAKLNKHLPLHKDLELTRSGTMGANYGEDRTDGQRDTGFHRQLSRSISKHMIKDAPTLSKEEMSRFERSILLQYQKKICDTVHSEDVVGRLVQRSMLTHEEKNKINLATKNSERMKIVLQLLSKKPSKAFDTFCDIIKFKYKAQYDLLLQAKKAPFQHDQPDELLEFSTAVKQQYHVLYSEYNPIPWHRSAHVPFEDCYLMPHITDYQGRRLTPQSIFDPHPKSTSPRRLLITGQSGAGKSTLCRHLATEWSKAGNSPMHQNFKLIFLLDLRRVTSDLVSSVITQCLPLSYRKSHQEVADLLRNHQKNVCFILDGLEDLQSSHDADIMEVIYRDLYKDCGVVLTANTSYPSQSLSKYFDTKLILLGLDRQQPEDLVQVYKHLAKVPTKTLADLAAKLATENETTFSVLGRNPLYCLCMCLIAEMDKSLDFETVSHLLQNFTQAAQRLHCIQNNINLPKDQVPDLVVDLFRKIEQFAFETLAEQRVTFPAQEIAALNPHTEDDLLNIVDIYQAGTPSRPVYDSHFCNKVIHEYLAASYVCNLEPRQREKHVRILLTEPHMSNTAVFFCGLPKASPTPDEDADDAGGDAGHQPEEICPMTEFYAEVAESNMRPLKGFAIKTGSGDGETVSMATLPSRISDLKFSLNCVEESGGEADALKIITRSLPRYLKMKKREIISASAWRGLAHLLAFNRCPVTELDLTLDHFADYEEHGVLQLAASINASQCVTSLKLHWTRAEVLGLFLARVFGDNRSIHALKLWDETDKAATNISATTWSNLRSACINMQSVREFTFLDCQNVAMVTSVIRNSPITLEELNLSGCSLDLIASQELGSKIERSQTLQLLNLTGVQLKRPDFVYIATGIRLTKSLKELLLAQMEFDRDSTEALADALIFNNTLRSIDLTRLQLSDESVDIIAQALATNQWLEQVLFTGSQLSEEAVKVLRGYKRKGLKMTGLVGRRYISPSERLSKENSQLSSPITAAS